MKSLYTYFLIGSMALSSVALTSCSDDEDGVAPTVDLNTLNFTHEPGEGHITLKWDAPANAEDAGFMYMKMTYTDPRDKKVRVKTISSYTEEIVIPNTRARYGDTYSFTFVPYSETDTPGTPFVLDKCRSNAAPATIQVERVKLDVTADKLWTNSQEPSEGPLSNVVDGNAGSFFHTIWSVAKPEYSYIDIDLGEEVDRLEIHTWNRRAGRDFPTNVSWTRLTSMQQEGVDVVNDAFFTYKHKQGNGAEFRAMYPAAEEAAMSTPVRYIRYCGNIDGTFKLWHMAEMEFNKIIVHKFDPETDEKEVGEE